MTAQGVHASLQENFRSSWRNWKEGLLTRCGHHCDAQTYAHSFTTIPSARVFFISLEFSLFSPHHELTINAISTFSSRSETFIYVTRVSYNNYELPRFVLYFEFIVICKLILPSKGSWSDREVYISRFVELNLI